MQASVTTGPIKVVGLDISLVDDGFVVFDPIHDRVHYLNPTASAVFELCDGSHSVPDIAAYLQSVFELPAPPTKAVDDCLETLVKEHLVDTLPSPAA